MFEYNTDELLENLNRSVEGLRDDIKKTSSAKGAEDLVKKAVGMSQLKNLDPLLVKELLEYVLPKKGVDYYTTKDIQEIVSAVKNLLPDHNDIKREITPQKNIDYFTKKDIAEIVSLVSDKLKDLSQKSTISPKEEARLYKKLLQAIPKVSPVRGLDGKDGRDGKDGKDGEDGKEGRDGRSLDFKFSGTTLFIRKEGEKWGKGVNLRVAFGGGFTGGAGGASSGGSFEGTMDDIADGVTYVKTENNLTDAEKTILGNTAGANTGDETQSTIKTKLGAATASVDGYATSTQITKLDGIASGAEVNVNADWNASSGDAQILNKPTIPTALSSLSDDPTHRLVTDAEKTIIGNTSGTNTGDETQSTIKTKLGAATASVDGYATSIQITKLDGIEAGADVTDAINVAAAGAVMKDSDIELKERSFKLDDALSDDEKWSGITISGVSGTTLVIGDLCYLNADDSRWELVDANLSDGYDKQLGICVLAGNDGSATEMLVYGKVRSAAFPSFTVGSTLFISETAGDITHTAPTTTDSATRIVGIALTAEDLLFNPSNDYFTHI